MPESQFQNGHFYPISAPACALHADRPYSSFNPRNIQYIPVVKTSAFLDLEQISAGFEIERFEAGSREINFSVKVIRKSCAEGAREAQGLTVIIDVFRAFSCQPLFFHFGAERVILEASPEKAIQLRHENPEFIMIGEVNEVPIKGAEMGNSPSQIIQRGEAYFRNKTIVHRTTAGVTGAVAACETADEVILGSFVMAGAIAKYIKYKNPYKVTMVAMGDRAETKAPEDEACGEYLEHLLAGSTYDPVRAFKKIVFQPTAQKFIQGKKTYLPREDPIFCLQPNIFDFVLEARKVRNRLEVFKVVFDS